MSKLTRKYGKKFTTFKAFTLATLAGIATVGMAQAQSPDVIMAPTPELSNLEFGTGDQSMTFETKEFWGINHIMDTNTTKVWSDEVEEASWLDQDFVSKITPKDTDIPVIKYNYTLDNFTNSHTYIDSPTSEITVDYVNEVSDAFIGSGVGFRMTIGMYDQGIDNNSEVETINALFVNTTGENGGSSGLSFVNFHNSESGTVELLKADFIGNGVMSVFNEGTIGKYTGNVIGNNNAQLISDSSLHSSGSDYLYYFGGSNFINKGEIREGIVNSNFINNIRTNVFGTAENPDDFVLQDGSLYNAYLFQLSAGEAAITSTNDLTIGVEDGFTSYYTGNKAYFYNTTDPNNPYDGDKEDLKLVKVSNDAVYMIPINDDKMLDLTLQAKTGGKLVINDNINGINYNLNITGDETGAVYLNNKVNSLEYDKDNDVITALEGGVVDVSLEKTNLILGRDADVLDGHNLTMNSGALSMLNGEIGQMQLNQLNVAGDTRFYGDVDLANESMDRVTAVDYSGDADIIVSGLNLLSDANNEVTEILFADYELKDNVRNDVTSTENNLYQSTAYSPIYKYDVSYSEKDDAGYFVFAKHVASDGGTSSDSFNPAVLGSSTSASVGAIGTMNQAFNYAFQHSADYMHIPYLERVSMRDRNKYALSITGDATDMGRFSPLYQPSDEGSSVWVKPYATFENVPLKNGPKVSNITYGTLVGFDSEMQSLKRGWDRVWTGYIGYNGASQRYSGIDSTQNGGLIGGTMTLYKGNFFNATTVSVGANVANNQTMYGSEDFAMLLSGIGNKTGYNFEFKGGKCILQPSLLMSYTFVNTFDYTNAAGVKIDNKPLHALQLAPGVKVIGNLKNGWQPYASVSMVWNLMGESDATANGVKLPEMSIKPYVQYGVGLQKRIKDHFMAYGQAMVQNGGRNGVSLTAGFRWAIGHDNCKYEKTQRQPEVKQNLTMKQTKSSNGEILKQVQDDRGKYIGHYEERSDVVISSNNEIATPLARNDKHKKILKQMTPEQKVANGCKYMNTSFTAKSGILRQY